jgi:hypothetical protein
MEDLMDYKRIHDFIIEKAKKEDRKKTETNYYESHHIIPKSLGGSNRKENIVLLKAREHFIIHKCLVKIALKENDMNKYHKMVHALHRFLYSKNSNEYKITSRDYEVIRKQHSLSISLANRGKKHTEEAKRNMSIAQLEYFSENPGHWKGKTHTEETRRKMSQKQSLENNPQFGKPRTKEEKKKISETMKGHKKSPETVEKFRNKTMSEEARSKIAEGLRLYHARRKMEKMGSAVHEAGS